MLLRRNLFLRLVSICTCHILFSAISAFAQDPAQSAQKPAIIPVQNSNSRSISDDDSYRVGPGDLLDIRVFGRPELGRETRVNNLGRIRLPFLDDIQVACLTENQMALLITEKYKKYLRDPQIDVFVKEYKSQPVAVIGSVAVPGRFQLQRRVRLLELLTFAGGSNLNAGGVVHIIRGSSPDFCEMNEGGTEGATAKAMPVGIAKVDSNLNAPLNPPVASAPAGAQLDPKSPQNLINTEQGVLLSFKLRDVLLGVQEANPYVKPGDIISVPETDQVFVTGVVVKPGPISIRTQITLLQAIGQAGGFMPEAARNRVRVVRQEPGSNNRKEFIFNVDDIQRKKAEDIALLPNDVVDVPASITKNVGRGLLAVGVGMVGYLPYLIFR